MSVVVCGRTTRSAVFIAASRTPLWLASGWGCRGRRLSRGSGNPCRPQAPGRGRHRHPLPARFSTAKHWHEPLPDALTLPSSSSRRSRCDRESSETRPFSEIEAPVAHAGIRKLTVKSFACEAFTSNCTTLSNEYRLFCVSTIWAPSCVRSEFEAFTGVRFERREPLDFSSSGKDHPLRSDKDHLVPSPVPRFPAPAGTSGLETSWDPQVSKPPAY
jgi:hypothetical protein